jgi:Domain of unknown function (DUF3885)
VSFSNQIETLFQGKAFERPLFYKHPGGLRFGLSETGSHLEQFLTALRKAMTVCADVFPTGSTLTLCVRLHTKSNPFAHRTEIRELRNAGLHIPKTREVWLEPINPSDWFEASEPEWWLNAVFEVPLELMQNILWCAMATEIGTIKPNPGCLLYLFNLQSGLMVWPYDDRGMDVVGPNHEVLAGLYVKHSRWLLEHDRAVMDAVFADSRGRIGKASQ